MIRIAVFASVLLGVAAMLSLSSRPVEGCAFSQTPTTYEAGRDRTAYLASVNAAGFNLIAPSDNFFGTPYIEQGLRGSRSAASEPYIPPTIMKSNAWIESAMAQAANSVPWASTGPTLISFDCGHGIMQITSGMTSPADSNYPSKAQSLVATHFLYNVGRGAAILAEKWNGAPEVRPVAGTDTNSDPHIIENWYFAVWSYNGFTGPGANRSNHPADPDYSWPRTGFSCGPAGDGYGHSYGDYPYQELVFGCSARPPSVDGNLLWSPINVSLPNLSDPEWSGPLSLNNFTSSDGYARMDMHSPRPTHTDPTARPNDALVPLLRGGPLIGLSPQYIGGGQTDVAINNVGQGILPWRARPAQSWITIDKQAGVSLSADVPCAGEGSCLRTPSLHVSVDDAHAAGSGWVDIDNLITGNTVRIYVDPGPPPRPGDANCDGQINALDAAAVLQYVAGIVGALPCLPNANASVSGGVDGLDALLILQYAAGLIGSLPP